ncbi:MAG TPA: methylenetetrahydrofolate reductase [Alphaproteobacteria bacterium]|nr:methylenetetrahydrofolate reductase [Alphaproteobacteria bacterium]
MPRPTISFEFFPPKNEDGAAHLWEAMPELAALGPDYMTVTYGAGGSTKDGTLETLKRAVKEFADIPFASHLTFLSTKKADLDPYIDALWHAGVKAIVALRGDLPKGTAFADFTGDEYYKLTSEFVAVLKSKYPFKIIVGGYPEKHPDAPSLEADIEALRLKCAAGADHVTTQFFFENDTFYRFVEKCRKAGITTPIHPGLLPIHDFTSMVRFAARCQAGVPAWLHEKFAGLDDKPEEARKIATDLLILQSEDLAAQGISHIHYYTLNKAPITLEACGALGYRT